MNEIEITQAPKLAEEQNWLLDMHSVVNVFNVLRCELVVLGISLAENPDYLAQGLAECDAFLEALRNPSRALDAARTVSQYRHRIMADVERGRNGLVARRDDKEVVEAVDNLRSVFDVLSVRSQELIDRAVTGDRWREHSIVHLRRNFEAVFEAIEKNSHGRYRIIYNAALCEPITYYVDFKLEGADGDRLWMPPVFQDVMRDLIANARKYTPPGGRITAALHQSQDVLRFLVEDSGRGIPPNEIPQVFEFGRRASNVADVRTMGGGFGLTKALVVTQRLGGRFWIGSRLGAGTRVRIHLPCPSE